MSCTAAAAKKMPNLVGLRCKSTIISNGIILGFVTVQRQGPQHGLVAIRVDQCRYSRTSSPWSGAGWSPWVENISKPDCSIICGRYRPSTPGCFLARRSRPLRQMIAYGLEEVSGFANSDRVRECRAISAIRDNKFRALKATGSRARKSTRCPTDARFPAPLGLDIGRS